MSLRHRVSALRWCRKVGRAQCSADRDVHAAADCLSDPRAAAPTIFLDDERVWQARRSTITWDFSKRWAGGDVGSCDERATALVYDSAS